MRPPPSQAIIHPASSSCNGGLDCARLLGVGLLVGLGAVVGVEDVAVRADGGLGANGEAVA